MKLEAVDQGGMLKYGSDGDVRTRPRKSFGDRLKCNKEKGCLSVRTKKKEGVILVSTIKKGVF